MSLTHAAVFWPVSVIYLHEVNVTNLTKWEVWSAGEYLDPATTMRNLLRLFDAQLPVSNGN
jgi:hypothetical protein